MRLRTGGYRRTGGLRFLGQKTTATNKGLVNQRRITLNRAAVDSRRTQEAAELKKGSSNQDWLERRLKSAGDANIRDRDMLFSSKQKGRGREK